MRAFAIELSVTYFTILSPKESTKKKFIFSPLFSEVTTLCRYFLCTERNAYPPVVNLNIFQKIKKFLADAEHGAIYVSFGSNLKANTMTPEKLQEFLKAFKKIPQKVIWKFENATLPEGYDDYVYTDTWMPQLDILCEFTNPISSYLLTFVTSRR